MSATVLSVNVNKIATLRNARGGSVPDIARAVSVLTDCGVRSITVHPRADERHITRSDVHAIDARLRSDKGGIEYNIEGDPRLDWIELVEEVAPTQATLVPVVPGEITSQAGWTSDRGGDALPTIIARLKARGTRVSVFVDPDPRSIEWAARAEADRVELYTEPYARAFATPERDRVLSTYVAAATRAVELGLGINAGHDLDLDNLGPLVTALPRLDEVSIGHALISEAVFDGLAPTVRRYLALLARL